MKKKQYAICASYEDKRMKKYRSAHPGRWISLSPSALGYTRYTGKRGRGRGKQGGDQAPVHSTKYDIREDYALPQKNKDSKLSELVKKPLKWLHIIK